MKANPLQFALVEWDDAWKASTEGATVDTARDSHKPVQECSGGWVMINDERGIQLGSSYSEDGEHRNRSFIPRELIKKITFVKLVPIRPKKAPNAEKAPDQ